MQTPSTGAIVLTQHLARPATVPLILLILIHRKVITHTLSSKSECSRTITGGYKGALQCGVYEPTNVISISYGGDEAYMPVNYQRRQCNEIMKLGLRGVSVVVASGDSGVAGNEGCLGPKGKIFNPDFP